MRGEGDSPSSSVDSSSQPSIFPASSSTSRALKRDLSTDLRLGLSISTSSQQDDSLEARSTLIDKGNRRQQQATFFVKVYMQGIPIGRKLDLFAHNGYDGLIRTLARMFRTTIVCSNVAQAAASSSSSSKDKSHILTYEDKEGDWMMVGDVPWELFLTNVKRLKITRSDKC